MIVEIEAVLSDLKLKYEKLVDYLKQLIIDASDDDLFDSDIGVNVDGERFTKAEFFCSLTKIQCETLLKQIGEITE